MDVKKVLYGTGMAGALAGAFLAGSVVLQPVFAQSVQTPPAAGQAGGPGAQGKDGEQADGPGEQVEPNGAAEQPSADDVAESAALQAKAKISADQAKQAALGQYPGGTVQAAALGDENGTVVYEVALTDAAGARHEVKVDATTGAVAAAQAERGADGAEAD